MRCSWHVEGRDRWSRGCSSAPHNAQFNPTTQTDPAPNVSSAWWRNPVLGQWGDIALFLTPQPLFSFDLVWFPPHPTFAT